MHLQLFLCKEVKSFLGSRSDINPRLCRYCLIVSGQRRPRAVCQIVENKPPALHDRRNPLFRPRQAVWRPAACWPPLELPGALLALRGFNLEAPGMQQWLGVPARLRQALEHQVAGRFVSH